MVVSGGAGRIRLGGAGHPRRRVRACSEVRFLRHNRERRPPGRHRCAKRGERRVPRSRPDDAERRGPCREANHPWSSGSFPAARRRRAVPTGGRRSLAWASLCTVGSVPRGEPPLDSGSFPPPAGRRAVPRGVTLHGGVGPRGEPPHPWTRGPSRRPPAAGCADRRSAFPCLRVILHGGVGAERGTTLGLGVLPGRPPAAGCADRRSAFPCLGVTLHGGVGPRGEPPLDSGSFPPPAGGGLCRPEVGVPWPGRHSARWTGGRRAERPRGEPPLDSGSFPPPAGGGLCRPEVGVPLPGRHSARWGGAERGTTPGLGVLPGRPPAAGCADRRSAFPGLGVTLHGGVGPRGEPPLDSGSFPAARRRRAVPTGGRRSLACLRVILHGGVGPRGEPPLDSGSFPAAPPDGGLCRPEVGVPWPRGPSRASTGGRRSLACASLCMVASLHGGVGPRGEPPLDSGSFPAARRRRAVPTGGRRSLAWASLCTVGWGREGNHPWTRGPSRPPAGGGLCRPEVGVPWPGRHSARWGGAERGTTLGLGVLPERGTARRRRRAVPTGGRRSLAWASFTVGWEPRGEPPLDSGSFPPPARRRRAVPTGGRRSLAWASLCTVGWGREGNHPQNTRNESERYPPRPHDTDDHGQSSGRSQSPAFTGLFRI